MKVQSLKIILVIMLIILVIGVSFFLLNDLMYTAYSDRYCSKSSAEAIENHVFVKKVEVKPKVFIVNNKPIQILDCWIEKEAKIYKLFSFNYVHELGRYRLCMEVKFPEKNLSYDYFFKFRKVNIKGGLSDLENGLETYWGFVEVDKYKVIEGSLVKKLKINDKWETNEIDLIQLMIK